MFEIFTYQEMMYEDRIHVRSVGLGLISNHPHFNNPCNAINPTPIGILTWGA